MTDRAHLLRDRLGPDWSFHIAWSYKTWTVVAWQGSETNEAWVEAHDTDLDEACRSVIEQAGSPAVDGWAGVKTALEGDE